MAEEGTLKSPGSSEVTGSQAPCRTDDNAFQWDVREGCEVRQILDRIADKWSLLVISLLDRQTLRFNELRRQIDGISQRMLSVTLRNLERDGLIGRTVYPEIPPRVEYQLTDLGCTLLATIQSLVGWTEDHQAEIARARADFDSSRAADQRELDAAARQR
jgi:DNA-binding HxlR family transcriptional regulator